MKDQKKNGSWNCYRSPLLIHARIIEWGGRLVGDNCRKEKKKIKKNKKKNQVKSKRRKKEEEDL